MFGTILKEKKQKGTEDVSARQVITVLVWNKNNNNKSDHFKVVKVGPGFISSVSLFHLCRA